MVMIVLIISIAAVFFFGGGGGGGGGKEGVEVFVGSLQNNLCCYSLGALSFKAHKAHAASWASELIIHTG